MNLCIVFNMETIPFILNEATEKECLTVIEKVKENYRIDRKSAIIRTDYIYLHAYDKKPRPSKRLYCLNDKIILQTDVKYEDEKESTRELLAYEHDVKPEQIYIIEI